MGEFIGFFSDKFGYILNWIYNLDFIKNYGVALIIFTIIIKAVMLPITIKQQKTMKKTAKIQERVKEIQKKFAGDQQRINTETIALYKEEKMSPCSGCLTGIVQMLILLSVFYLISQPLTFMRHIDKEVINNYVTEIKEKNTDSKLMYTEIAVIREKGSTDENVNINMEFLGLDLSNVPSGAMDNIKVYIIPALYVLTSVLSIRLLSKKPEIKEEKIEVVENKGENSALQIRREDEIDFTTQMNKNMNFITPLLSVMISMVAPLGLALYWLTNNILTICEKLFMNKFLKEKEEE